ncbi:hypothetical protein ACIPSE_23780 [Streptomyces sp. NPDC090106]|uniref:hypothetical protein n=1 Tax=Streptomyces sp. NPDC090106 TaxID=3365946 RepID=UPI00382D130E
MHQHATDRRAPLPALRAAVFAGVGTALGVSAHHLSGEVTVPWAQGSAVAAGLFLLGLVGVRRPRHAVTVVACSVAGQSGLHLWLTLTTHTPRTPMTHDHMHHGAHAHGHDSVAMTAAHTLAAVLVALLLHRADTACWTLARGLTALFGAAGAHVRAARTLSGRPGPVGTPGAPVRVRAEDARPRSAAPVLAYAVVRRGPPAGCAALVA